MDSLGASTVRCEPSVSRLATFRVSNGRRARTFTALTSAYVPKRDGYQRVVPLKVAHNDTTRWKTSESDSCASPRRCRPGAPESLHSTGPWGPLTSSDPQGPEASRARGRSFLCRPTPSRRPGRQRVHCRKQTRIRCRRLWRCAGNRPAGGQAPAAPPARSRRTRSLTAH